MNNVLESLEQLKPSHQQQQEQHQIDRSMYIKGRDGYPTAPDESLSERARGCYMMGFNVTQWEKGHV
jgi:hypothetical protein